MSPAAPFQVPGWYGKLPGMGDFAHRRMPAALRTAWDRWLQGGLTRLRSRHENWTAHYLQAPLWCFVIGADVIGSKWWMGVLMPSVDAVGRYFPFTIVSELVAPPTELEGAALAYVRQWWWRASKAAFEGLERDFDAKHFEARLHELFMGDAAGRSELAGDAPTQPIALPDPGQSLWLTDPDGHAGQGMTSKGLPQDEQFEALFGCVPDGLSPGAKEAK
ncbi:Type VI secretion system protein ImpM [Burkholderiales bacterium 8X]|nr:Type VI secretion system protein ImpM [Burkholderiales bacterium 8X]